MTLDDQHVLVTGGAGFIGSHVTRALLENGADVSVVDNFFAGEPGYIPDEVTRHEVDTRSDECAAVIVETAPNVVVHLAALHYIPYCNDNPEEAFEVNVMGTRNLLEAAREVDGLERVVYASSAAVYPPRDDPHAETDQPGPTDIYGRSKLVGEDLLELFAAETDVPAATARLFNTYGTNETNPHLVPAILDQLEDGNRTIELGNLKPARDFIHVEDIADALVTLAAYDNDGYRAYNVGTGTEHTVREVAEQVGEALGEDLTITQDEERVRESDRPHLCADISRITRETDWKPQTEFVDGLRGLLKAEGLVE
jgi:UDP-glucose 4-epimerase